MTTDLGEVVNPPRSLQLSDPVTGLPVDADSTPTWSVTLPDGTAGASPAVQHGSLGQYWVNYVPAVGGRFEDTWTATVGGQAVKFGPDVFQVRNSAPAVSLASFRAWLKLTDWDASRDEILRDLLDRATVAVEGETGRTYRRVSVVETHDGGYPFVGSANRGEPGGMGAQNGRPALFLRRKPVLSITSVVELGTAVTAYTIDPNSGRLTKGPGSAPARWLVGLQSVVVTYTAGMTAVPENVQHAIIETARNLLEPLRGGSGLPTLGHQDGGSPLVIPPLARQLLGDQYRIALA